MALIKDDAMSRFLCLLLLVALAGCSGGAVVFAPTPLPPDLSPLRYDHPSGAFSVNVPRNWPVFVQNTTALAAASFAAPGENEPALRFAVMNLGNKVDSAALGELMNQYQTQIRTDANRYSETGRQAMGDGSWRLTGLSHSAGGVPQQVNTFIQQSDTFVGVAEVVLPDDAGQQAQLQAIVNSFTINPDAPLEATDPTALAFATSNSLDIIHVSTWSTPAGVFFITGEVGNYGSTWASDVPVRALLKTSDGLGVAEATDFVMGYSIPPGGFAPFSLRFGQGQSALTTGYELSLGGADWQPEASEPIVGQESLKWSDDSTVGSDGRLLISGSVSNSGSEMVRNVRAVVTIFDTTGNVIAAGFTDVTPSLAPNASADFNIAIPEIGGTPVNYIVTIQGLP
jgi:hypothetical protein